LKGKNGAFSTILPHHQEEDNVTEKNSYSQREKKEFTCLQDLHNNLEQ
jgi:hypothetical protein